MKKHALLLALVLGISSLVLRQPMISSAAANIVDGRPDDGWMQNTTSISPAEPTPSDEIILTVSWWMPSTGYGLEITAARTEGHDIWVDVVTHAPGPYAQCCQVFTRTDATASLGWLEPGTYTLYISRDGGDYGAVLTFTVFVEAPGGSIGTSPDDDAGAEPDNGESSADEGVGQGHLPPLVIGASAQTCDCFCHRWPAFFSGRPCPFCGCDPSHSSNTGDSASGGGSLLDSLRQRIADLRQR